MALIKLAKQMCSEDLKEGKILLVHLRKTLKLEVLQSSFSTSSLPHEKVGITSIK